jgi:TRAP-type mannitol/chloroaromatic compound transport system permease small subunit
MLDRLLQFIDMLCLAFAWLAGALLLALAVMGMADIVLLSLFSTTLSFSIEYSGYFLGLILFAGSGWTLAQGGHIRVNVVLGRLSPPAQRRLDLVCTLFALGVAVFLAAALVDYSLRSLARGTLSYHPSQTPLFYPQLLFAAGPCVLALALLARAIRLWRNRI